MKKWTPRKPNEVTDSNKKKTKCFSCSEWGHISKYCEEAAKKSHQVSAKTAIDMKSDWALSASQKKNNNPDVWILDSGATEHMTSEKKKFSNFRSYESLVEVANSEKIKVTGIGDITLKLHEEGTTTLANVLYVPNLGGNLLSLGRIEERGFKAEFDAGEAKILERNGKTILKAKRNGRLYIVEEITPKAYTARTAKSNLLHRRLGHNSNTGSCTDLELQEAESKSDPCHICIQGKMKRKKFPKVARTKATEVLETIHADVVGRISPPSLGGSNYLVTFTDEYTRYVTVYPIGRKNEVLDRFKQYKHMVENIHSKKIKVLRSDNGGEFRSKEFDQYLIQHGIRRQTTVPETPQQNGIAERKQQTLLNMTRCLLIESGLDKTFWAEAVSTSAYLLNKCQSTSIQGRIPEEMWYRREVQTDHLRVFGCRAWCRVKSQLRNKLDARAREYIFVGYPDGTKGYRIYDQRNNKFFNARDIEFEENVLPYRKSQQDVQKDDIFLHIENGAENMAYIEEQVQSKIIDPSEITRNDKPSECTDSVLQIEDSVLQVGDTIDAEDLVETEITHENEKLAVDSKSIDASEDTQETDLEEHFFQNISTPIPNQVTSRNRSIKPPKHFDDFVLYKVKAEEYTEERTRDPNTVAEALASSDSEEWQSAMNEELENLKRAQTWELVLKPPGAKVISSRWIFRKKKDNEGKCKKFRARLVAKGYQQVAGVNFHDTFAPVIKLKSIRILLAMAAELDLEIHQMDITAAYLNGTLQEDVYMTQPEGCAEKGMEHLICHLKRSLYGLRQSGRVWNSCLDDFLKGYGLKRAQADPCIYFSPDGNLRVGVYVDDLIIIGKIEDIEKFKSKIKEQYLAKDLGPAHNILSMKITKEEDGSITLDQTTYIKEFLETFKMTEAKPAATPLDPSIKYYHTHDHEWDKIKAESSKIPYRQAIGSLLYISCGTRPDLAYPAAYMSQFNEKPAEEHWRGVKHIMRYLKGTCLRKLKFKKNGEGLQAFSDADWGGDRTDRKSFSGYILLLAGGPVSWSSKKQPTIALSSTEAEYMAMCHIAKEVQWIRNLLSEVCPNLVNTTQKVFVDNQGAIFIANNRVTSERSKHIDIKYFFIRDLVAEKSIVFEHIASQNNTADVLTKNVSKKTLIMCNYAETFL